MAKIAFICLTFHWPPLGGAWVEEKELLTCLSQYHDVSLIVPDYQRFFPRGRICEKMPFEIVKIPFNSFTFNFYNVSKQFKKAIDKINPDYIIFGEGGVLKPYILNKLKDYPFILRFYSTSIWCFNKNYFRNGELCNNTMRENFFKCIICNSSLRNRDRLQEYLGALGFIPSYLVSLKNCYKNAKTIIVYNEGIKESLNGFNENVMVIPGGVNVNKFIPDYSKLKKKNKEVRIIMSGRSDDPAKGLNILRDACVLLKSSNLDFKVDITFPTSNATKNSEIFNVRNWIDQDNLPKFYQEGDICVIPSLWPEPFGITAIEAMACGIPVIASMTGGLQEIIEDGVTGFLFEPGDSKELARKLKILILDKEIRNYMGEKARERVENFFDWDKIFKKYYLNLFK